MASSEGEAHSVTAPREALEEGVEVTPAAEPAAGEVEKNLVAGEGVEGTELQKSGASSPTGGDAGPAAAAAAEEEEEREPEKTLEYADQLFEKGSKAIEDGDLVEAVDSLSRALEIRVAHYGELAPECASSYYKYGCALLYKAQEEADPLVHVPKSSERKTETDTTVLSAENSVSSSASVSNVKPDHTSSNNEEDVEEGPGDKDEEDDDEGSDGDGEELAEADEDDSDLDLAWKMLDVARAIVEKRPENTMEKVNILAALGEVAVEREDIETSLSDYQKALSILEHLVEPDHRRIVELNFRICLVLELGSKIEEAIPYCKKAASLCKSRLQHLKEDIPTIKGSTAIVADAGSLSNTNGSGSQSLHGPVSDSSNLEKEEEAISGILSELEKKLEDLQQVMSNPKSVLAELMKLAATKPSAGEKNTTTLVARSTSLNSSQMGVIDGGFDSPSVSSAATNGNVTHLGVVGRGIKRASIAPSIPESTPKKPTLELSADKANCSVSEVLDSTAQDAKKPTE